MSYCAAAPSQGRRCAGVTDNRLENLGGVGTGESSLIKVNQTNLTKNVSREWGETGKGTRGWEFRGGGKGELRNAEFWRALRGWGWGRRAERCRIWMF